MAAEVLLPIRLPQQQYGQEFQCWAAVTVAVERLCASRPRDIARASDPINAVCLRFTTQKRLKEVCENAPRLLGEALSLRERVELPHLPVGPGFQPRLDVCREEVQRVLTKELLVRRRPVLAQVSFEFDPDSHHVVILGGLRLAPDRTISDIAVFDSMPFGRVAPVPNLTVSPTWVGLCQGQRDADEPAMRLVNGGYVSLLNTLVGDGLCPPSQWRRRGRQARRAAKKVERPRPAHHWPSRLL